MQAKGKLQGKQDETSQRGQKEQERLRQYADEQREQGQESFDGIQDETDDRR
ncbi:hypothetical protein DWB77_00117 [Streptomyces hundungensis]|uniref:Uncharacterized protein n=1 Tax=Streptomyces hundungensis TaxID=1077946 RepID=A0A387HAN4_9ACTN|nr:hypothetical protein [Streptomyces hundungensis]AYG78010.1 hypothetical protein DWB77_00117 [Streptomyces hundungensis]